MDKPQVVTVRGLRKAYGDRVVVDGLDLDVPTGEIVGLIGANGAGKTTTVECIQGLRKPDAGILRVLGYDPVTQAGELRPLIGSQLQDSALPDRLRVAEAVALFGTARARGGGELLERFGLAQRRRSAFGSLSGGPRGVRTVDSITKEEVREQKTELPGGQYDPEDVRKWLTTLADHLDWQADNGFSPTNIDLLTIWRLSAAKPRSTVQIGVLSGVLT